MFAKLAVMNLVKHRKRTLLIVFSIMASVLVMEVVAGMLHGISVNFFRNLTQEGGHVTVTASGRREALNPFSLDHSVQGYREAVDALRMLDGVDVVEPVLVFGALLQHGERTVTLAGLGVLPETPFYRNVSERVIQGAFPPRHGVVVSRTIADLLHAWYGDEILVVVEDSTGSPYYLQYPVTGVFETGATELDEHTFFLSHGDAEELVFLEGATTEIRVRLHSPEGADAFAAAAAARLDLPRDPAGRVEPGSDDARLEIRTYLDEHAGLVSLIELMDFFIVVMNLFVVIVAASVITNAILMNVFERTAEFGTMRAIGLKKRGVAKIVLTEGVIQGIAGSLLGLVAGIPIVLYFSANGLDFGGYSEMLGMGSSSFFFAHEPLGSAMNGLAGVLIAIGGSLYAALVGVRLTILEALSHG